MRLADKTDRKKIVEILSSSFQSNPSVLHIVKKDRNIQKRIYAVCDYSFKTALLRKGVYISGNEMGVALFYRYNAKKEGIADYFNQALLLFKAIGIFRLRTVLKRERYIKSKRGHNGNFIYFWFLGVHPEHQDGNAARELKEQILQLSDSIHLPIYLETSVEKNRRVYQRYGFEVYHQWVADNKNTTIYFMRRMPETSS